MSNITFPIALWEGFEAVHTEQNQQTLIIHLKPIDNGHCVCGKPAKAVELVYQELWGLLLGYNLVRREASQAAVEHGRMPNEISFKNACQFIASQLKVMSKAVSPGNTPKRLNSPRGDLSILFIDKRPKPNRPRAVKISKTRYLVNHKAAPLK